jgi:murein DD-endopeptidase MepM/ murein hydrolase activator NlpD
VRKYLKTTALVLIGIIIIGYLIPGDISSPIVLKNISKIDAESFWYYPWGNNGVHKGIDIFCEKKTDVLAPVAGLVMSTGNGTISGNYIYIIGPGWRIYYFAHLDTIEVSAAQLVSKGYVLGKAGNTGNALNTPTHLHFSIQTIFPYPWLNDAKDIEGWKKMFYLNPVKELNMDIKKHQFLSTLYLAARGIYKITIFNTLCN